MGLDVGRQADIARCDRVINDPNAPEKLRKKAQEAKYQIQSQQGFKSIERGRAKLAEAARSNDPNAYKATEKLADQMHRAFS